MVLLVVLLVAGAAVALETTWGQTRLRDFAIARVRGLLRGRGTLTIGRVSGELRGALQLDSVALRDARGTLVASIERLEVEGGWRGLLTGDIHLGRVLLRRPFVLFDQAPDSSFTLITMFANPTASPSTGRSLSLVMDSLRIVDGRVQLLTLDSIPTRPKHLREFAGIGLALGSTHLRGAAGSAVLGALAAEISTPALSLRDARGTVAWWPDSVHLTLDRLALPASRATVRGRIAWNTPTRQLDVTVRADTLALADIAALSPKLPVHGVGSGELHIGTGAAPGAVDYDFRALDITSGPSHLTARFRVTSAKETAVRDLTATLAPLDLDLLREVFGPDLPKAVWQGTLTGTVVARGGPLRTFLVDSAPVTFTDRRIGGVVSHATVSGGLDLSGKITSLTALRIRLADLDVRTLGAVARAADSLRGVLAGEVTLDGPSNDLRFHDLAVVHIDGSRARSYVRGGGIFRTDSQGEWLNAALTLDTVAVATLLQPRTTVPLRGSLSGTLGLVARRDTMRVDTKLRLKDGGATFVGYTLLDSTRTVVRGATTFTAFDPGALLQRRDIPFLRLSGSADVEVDGDAKGTDAHLDAVLDTTTRVGESRITYGQIRVGIDSAGIHVDTAEVHAPRWRVSARGRLAHTGASHDTLFFRAVVDSLLALRPLLLDSLGKPMLDSLRGSVTASGVLVGAMDSLTLAADFGAQDLAQGNVSVVRAIGRADLTGLPTFTTGRVVFTADSIAAAGRVARRTQMTADLADGKRAHVKADAAVSDTLSTRFDASVAWAHDSTAIAIDSLVAVLGDARWTLEGPSRGLVTARAMSVDSLRLVSTGGAHLRLAANLPDSGAITGELRAVGIKTSEFAFTGLLSPDLTATMRVGAELGGTRDAPTLTAIVVIDSVKMLERAVPTFTGLVDYADRRATATVRAAVDGREVVTVTADLPVDLSLRSVDKRLLDTPITARVIADSAKLAGLEAFVPFVTDLSGTLDADVAVAGTWKRVSPNGSARITNGGFELPLVGMSGRAVAMNVDFRGDSVFVRRLRLDDGVDARDTISATGVLVLADTAWQVDLRSVARQFNVIDDPRLATARADWDLTLKGPARQPALSGNASLPRAIFYIGNKRVRALKQDPFLLESKVRFGMPTIERLAVTLGEDVRLKSTVANVQLNGSVELFGQLNDPYILGEIRADRGTYRVDLSAIKRSFRVDSGTVRVAGTKTDPAELDIWTSYLVRRNEGDIKIGAHLTGTTALPRLDLFSDDLGSAASQTEIISYLVFGTPSFALDGRSQSTVESATAALVPTVGGFLEGVLSTLLPFFNSLQVTSLQGTASSVLQSPVDGLLNSFAITGGKQLSAYTFANVSVGVCRGSQLSSVKSPPAWFGLSAEYRPKERLSAVASMDPGASPCNRVGNFFDRYQFGLDLFRDWRW